MQSTVALGMLGHAGDMQLQATRYVAKHKEDGCRPADTDTCGLAMLTARLCATAVWPRLSTISTQEQGRYCMFGHFVLLALLGTIAYNYVRFAVSRSDPQQLCG